MKKRNMMLVTSLLLAVLLIGGGTFAWFTAETEAVDNVFTAGTLDIELIEYFNECRASNVNPGDCLDKYVKIRNLGTKYAVVRIAKEVVFEAMNGDPLWAGVVEYDLNDWWFEKDGYFVYKKVLGTIDHWNDTTMPLFDKICFDGDTMTNDYQGSTFTLSVKGEAIQATNDAPNQWGLKVIYRVFVAPMSIMSVEGEVAEPLDIFDVEGTEAEPEEIGDVEIL